MWYSPTLSLVCWRNVLSPATRTDVNDWNTVLYTIKHIIYRLLFFLAISQQLFNDGNDDDDDDASTTGKTANIADKKLSYSRETALHPI